MAKIKDDIQRRETGSTVTSYQKVFTATKNNISALLLMRENLYTNSEGPLTRSITHMDVDYENKYSTHLPTQVLNWVYNIGYTTLNLTVTLVLESSAADGQQHFKKCCAHRGVLSKCTYSLRGQ
jgi:hypothetical protein